MPLEQTPTRIEPASTFEIKIDFEKHSDRPSRVFQSMAQLIESFQLVDNDLLLPFDVRADTVLILEDIQAGSLRTVLTTMLRSVDDEALKSGEWKKIVGGYLLESKYRLIRFLANKRQITERTEIENLAADIHLLAVETDVKQLPSYKPVPLSLLLRDIHQLTLSLGPLKPTDSAKFIADRQEVQFNQSFEYHQDSVEALLTKETRTFERPERLKVKKPDYLGDSMWEFIFQNRVIAAKIVDHDWLLRFQARQVDVRPGDALSVALQTEVSYGFQNEEIAVHYRVTRVSDVLPSTSGEQRNLL